MKAIISTIERRDINVFDLPKLTLNEIFHPLTLNCRFNGHIPTMYTVGQHSLNGYRRLLKKTDNPQILAQFLFHDASESILNDLVTPIKNKMPDYQTLENQVQTEIYNMFNINPLFHTMNKEMDKEMFISEYNHFFKDHEDENNEFQYEDPHTIKLNLIYEAKKQLSKI